MRVLVTFEVDVPEIGATNEQITEWLRWSFHDKPEIEIDNPLYAAHGDAESTFRSLMWRPTP
jgi:hypothetical protein